MEQESNRLSRKKRYLFFSALAFLFSFLGFSGTLGPFSLPRSQRGGPIEDPIAQGVILLAIGFWFLYLYLKPKK